ncbi:M20 metallopeptidase family protein [Brevibacillus fluminis]|uniref:M20 metallopeptidase family protein n=1 Tax=Brevibacillus fluminis TaxID=511487 RepID=UPI003F8B7DEE
MLETMYDQLAELYQEMVELRRYFHMHPELSFEEVETPAKIAAYLTELGIEVKTGVGGNGVLGYIRGGKPGKTVALRADFDALPIQDEKDVPYKSQVPGVMHACGHDGHTATLLAVAKVLQANREKLAGNVVLIHQFAEEVAPGGAKAMIEAGCLDGVDAIFGTHLSSSFPTGVVGYRSGSIAAASDRFSIVIQGKGGHGAAPQESIDPIAVGAVLITHLQQIVSRRIDPQRPAVFTIGSFHSGEAFNVIPDTATIQGTVRTYHPEVQERIMGELERIVKGTCEAANASYSLHYTKGYPAVINHKQETLLLAECAKQVLGEEHVFEMEPFMSGEDFAYYLQKVPGTFFFTGASNEELGSSYPHHHPRFDIDEKAMLAAAKVMVTATVRYLENAAAGKDGGSR